MKRSSGIAVVTCIWLLVCTRKLGAVTRDEAVALPLAAFASGFRTCSRPIPKGITGYWQVSPDELATIDRQVIRMLRNRRFRSRLADDPASYLRQYLGFRRGDRRFIYVNAFSALSGRSGDWKTKFVKVCDAGNSAWGLEYELNGNARRLTIDRALGDPLEGVKL